MHDDHLEVCPRSCGTAESPWGRPPSSRAGRVSFGVCSCVLAWGLLCSSCARWFCWGKGCVRGAAAALLVVGCPRMLLVRGCSPQPTWKPSGAGAHTGALHTLDGGSKSIRYKHVWEKTSFCGLSERCSKCVGLCEQAAG